MSAAPWMLLSEGSHSTPEPCWPHTLTRATSSNVLHALEADGGVQ